MDKILHRERAMRLLPILASAVIAAGLLMMVFVFRHSQNTLVESQDSQLMRTAQSVDNNIEAHEGSISMESAAGQGTAFTVSFPAAPREEPAAIEHE